MNSEVSRIRGWGADVLTRRFFAIAAIMAIAGCSLDKQSAPPLAGPSELGLSLAVSATPDIITQDGQSQATIEVLARDASSQPVRGLTVRADMVVGGQLQDFGTLSSKVVSTNNDGRAAFVYRAPAAPAQLESDETVVTIEVRPVGANYAGSTPREVQLKLVRPGVIVVPGDGPVPSFFFSPTTPREEDDVFFDGSASTGNIVSYSWSFGDGRTSTSSSPTTRHHYGLAGTYSATLTVTDDKGRQATSAPKPVTVTSQLAPTASFTFSPTPVKQHATLNFNASLSTPTVGRTIVDYKWDFGDGSPIVNGSGPTVQKAYGAVGSFTVVLIVTDDAGRTGKTSQAIAVTAP
jgi:PKD repeat protein